MGPSCNKIEPLLFYRMELFTIISYYYIYYLLSVWFIYYPFSISLLVSLSSSSPILKLVFSIKLTLRD